LSDEMKCMPPTAGTTATAPPTIASTSGLY
jgi:hypothetical protein